MKIGSFIVSWTHNNNGTHQSGSTECRITLQNTEDLMSGDLARAYLVSGLAIKHKGDNYDKNKGRYISFKRAVSKISSKEDRKLLWDGIKELAPNLIAKGSLK